MAWYARETQWTCPLPAEEVRPLVAQIEEAFAHITRPPLSALCASRQGDEPGEVCLDLGGLEWRAISPAHLDRNYTALSFMTAEGACYYLPAYMRAEAMGLLQVENAVFHLEYDPARFASYTPAQRSAVAAFLRFVRDRDADWNPDQAARIDRALAAHWGEAG